MEPKLAQELMQLPQFREFLSFLAREAAKLDTLQGIELVPVSDIPAEVKGRAKAHATLVAIIAQFIDPQTPIAAGMDSRDYQV